MDSVKDKSTGEIFSVIRISWGSGETEYTVVGGDGKFKVYKESAFKRKFEEATVDFSYVFPQLNELSKTNIAVQRLLYPLARRFHPGGYFKPGVLVHFQFSGYQESAVPDEILQKIKYMSYGNDNSMTYIVLDIEDCSDHFSDEGYYEYGRLRIAQYRGPEVPLEDYQCDFCLPICKAGYSLQDAYFYLQRYDMAY